MIKIKASYTGWESDERTWLIRPSEISAVEFVKGRETTPSRATSPTHLNVYFTNRNWPLFVKDEESMKDILDHL